MASQALVRSLDKVFSLYIRHRDSRDGYFVCCSCGQTKPYEQADAGHYINRRFMATRWREDNVHAQCRYCNRFQEGAGPGYSIFMLKKYGQDKIEFLDALKNTTAKWSDTDVRFMIRDYKEKLKAIK